MRLKGMLLVCSSTMDVRYEGNDLDDPNMPDVTLVNHETDSGLTEIGKLCALLAWHEVDPVDEAERARHEKIFEWQGNRNPFIDFPERAAAIWGDECQ